MLFNPLIEGTEASTKMSVYVRFLDIESETDKKVDATMWSITGNKMKALNIFST